MKLDELIELLVDNVLNEVNSISVGGALLQTPDSIQGFQSGGFGVGDSGEGEGFDGDVQDENFEQFGQHEKHRRQLFDFMWNGDDPENEMPKVKYVAV